LKRALSFLAFSVCRVSQLRLCKSQNIRLLSASSRQVAQQAAMECIPLVMEPVSRFYTSPVLVLDFRSLYPSMMIAHNICYRCGGVMWALWAEMKAHAAFNA
jgi:DNA polymerase elongation subunit (family B)